MAEGIPLNEAAFGNDHDKLAPVDSRSARPRTLLEALARARDTKTAAREALEQAELGFLSALVRCRPRYSWAEIAAVAGLTRAGVRYHVEQLNQRRQGKGKPQ